MRYLFDKYFDAIVITTLCTTFALLCWASEHRSQQRIEELMAECMQDRKHYECVAMYNRYVR